MNIPIPAMSGIVLLASIASASAMTVTNTDKVSHSFTLTPKGGQAETVMLKASASGSYDCSKGCEIRMGALKATYDADVEKVTIKDGKFVKM